ncbi:MAG: hypothetical protein AB8B99_17965 [Phormidesmis sp.]
MTTLLDRIETILTDSAKQNENTHPFTNWSGQRIVEALTLELPKAKNEREKETLNALKMRQYSRCKIYPQLVDDNAFIEAVNLISDIPETTQTGSTTLPVLFNQCARTIIKAREQAVSAISTEEQASTQAKAAAMSLEKIAINIFAKGLGDEADETQSSWHPVT